MGRRVGGWVNGCIRAWLDACMGGWMMDGRVGGWICRLFDGQTHRQIL